MSCFFFTSVYLQAFAKGLELDAGNVDLQEGAKAARLDLTLEELHQVRHSPTSHQRKQVVEHQNT